MTDQQSCNATPYNKENGEYGDICGKGGYLMLKYERRGSYYGTIVLCRDHSQTIWEEIEKVFDPYDI